MSHIFFKTKLWKKYTNYSIHIAWIWVWLPKNMLTHLCGCPGTWRRSIREYLGSNNFYSINEALIYSNCHGISMGFLVGSAKLQLYGIRCPLHTHNFSFMRLAITFVILFWFPRILRLQVSLWAQTKASFWKLFGGICPLLAQIWVNFCRKVRP